jgi:hypothetical protein
MKKLSLLLLFTYFICIEVTAQWTADGINIYNTNSGNVGIGNNVPSTLLFVAKNITEPTITVRNLGGFGGATYTMIDDASGANWKFKATLSGGFKIRDHSSSLDVITIEPNSFANAIYIRSTDNIGIGTATPANSALVDLSSTTKGFLLPRMTQAQILAISSPDDGLQVYCTTDGKLYIYVALMGQWKELAYGSATLPATPFVCGNPISKTHIAGIVAPVSKSVVYGTTNNISGEPSKCWTTSNLGASNQPSSASDATEAAAGWYWQFNRRQGYKHDGTTRTPNSAWIYPITENSNWVSGNDPCVIELGNGWRLVTSSEWNNVDTYGNWATYTAPYNSGLKLHTAGYLHYSNGALNARGGEGYYWSSNQSDNSSAANLGFYGGYCGMYTGTKSFGYPVRCIRE